MQVTEERLDKKNSFFRDFIWYTFIFGITAVCAYAEFLYFGRSLLINTTGNIDGWAQHYPIYVEIKQILADFVHGNGFAFWAWDIGLGEDVWMLLKSRILDPLTYIVIAFPEEHIDIGYSIMVVVRQYLSGVAFMVFGRYICLDREQVILGGLCYAFSGWAVLSTITQGTFTTATILFPLLVLGVDKLLNDHSPWMFSVTVALLMIYSTIWAYVSAVIIFVYFIVRYFHYRKFNLKDFGCHFASFAVFGALGVLLSAFSFLQTFIKTTGANTESTVTYDAWYTMREYLRIPSELFSYTEIHTPYSAVFLACTLMVLLPIAFLQLKKKSTAAIMMTLCLIAGLFPVTGSILNGFSYSVGRWYFVVVFFMAWAMTECLTKETFARKGNLLIMVLFLLAVCTWNILVGYKYLQIISLNAVLCTVIGGIFGLLTIAVFAIRARIGEQRAWRNLCAAFAVVLMIGSIAGALNVRLAPGLGEQIYGYQPAGYTYENYEDTCQKIARTIQAEDTSFFRSERIAETKVPPNKNMFHDMRSIYTFSSSVKKSWHEYNKLMGNNFGYFDRTASFSNGNRAGMDTLMGVKYYFIDPTPGGRDEAAYVPYGYQYHETIDGVDVYKNQYSIGLGATYDGFITESELMEYPYLEREQAVLQA
ncbi:MAG: YfhO family protein, partial [Clostridia bacterium]|nr:YfhO family protein [Clostridia bacterium]